MLYVVECAYTDPQSETAWNTFYNQEKLPALVSVPGFYASQRFRALSEECPRYLALHDIHDATVIDSDAYRRNGGGHFARWQSAITTGTATSMLQIAACGRSGLMRCSC